MTAKLLYVFLFLLSVDTQRAASGEAGTVPESKDANASVCQLQPDVGPCLASIHRWYYNITLRKCGLFVYGGCEGNGNRFERKQQCKELCVKSGKKPAREDPCSQPVDEGPCDMMLRRWYYDQADDTCKAFIYGGCMGNANNFETEESCLLQCVKGSNSLPPFDVCTQPLDFGPCKASMPRWYFNLETRECKRFAYGGCQGNSNNFISKQDCEKTCLEELKSFGECGQPASRGLCKALTERWYFNVESRKCETFSYGGCGGNSNNFLSKQECETFCLDEMTCNQKVDQGPCRGNFQKWYFNRDGKKCEPFTYGGCEGNSNRFDSKAACDKKCRRADK